MSLSEPQVYKCSQPVFIWCTIGPKSFLFGTVQFSLWASGTVNYDYIVTNSINSLLIGSRCIPNGIHTKQFLSQFGTCLSKTLLSTIK